ncbi:hypothetical protein F5X96DRAFT_626697, partial [Biscogniauxia mediterranea]
MAILLSLSQPCSSYHLVCLLGLSAFHTATGLSLISWLSGCHPLPRPFANPLYTLSGSGEAIQEYYAEFIGTDTDYPSLRI